MSFPRRFLVPALLSLALLPAVAGAAAPGSKLRTSVIVPADGAAERAGTGIEAIRTAGPDTLRYGFYTLINGEPFAVPGETWTFDHGAADPFEGWTAEDLSTDPAAYFRVVTPASWDGHDNAVPCPSISPSGTAWLGRFQDEATAACYEGGLGYGNEWAQAYTSPLFAIPGSGDLNVRFKYFADMEQDYDRVKVKILFPDGSNVTCGDPITGVLGSPAQSIWADGLFSVAAAQLAGKTQCRLRFEMTSDISFSDEDGSFPTEFGPFGFGRLSAQRSGPRLAQYFDQALSLTPQAAVVGANTMSKLGTSVCVLDVNQDGYVDVIVGEPGYSNGQSGEGRVLCFHGGPSGISVTPSWSYESNVAGAALGYSLAGGVLNSGSPSPLLLVGAPFYSGGQANEGRIYLFTTTVGVGLNAAPFWEYESNVAGAELGWSVTCGDLDGTFYLAAGAPYFANGQSNEGRLYGWSFFDIFNAPTWLRESNQVDCFLGTNLTWIDDSTYGSYLVAGVPWSDGLSGADCGNLELRDPATGQVRSHIPGIEAGGMLGRSVAPLGDFDGDGGTDFAATGSTGGGVPMVYIVSAEGASYSFLQTTLEDPSFGPSLSAVGRLDEDATGDIAMGGGSSGTVRLLDLDAGPPFSWREAWSVGVTGSSASLTVAGGGDVDGDGHNDLVIGVPEYSGSGSGRGRLQLHLWSNTDNSGWVAEAMPSLGTHVGTAPVSSYALPPGACGMQGNVLELHDANLGHPAGQHVRLFSPIVDLTAIPDDHDLHAARWRTYQTNDMDTGIFLNYGWIYYPWVCPANGQVGWSPPGSIPSAIRPWRGGSVGCWSPSVTAETEPPEVPATAEKMRFYIELYSSCEEFGIPPGDCSNVTDFSPIFDDLVLDEVDGGSIAGVVLKSTLCSANAPKAANVAVRLDPGGQISLSDANGRFAFYDLTPGSYTVTVTPPANWTFRCGQPSVAFNGTPVRDLKYGVYPVTGVTDLAVSLAGGQAKAGFETRYGITCVNTGSVFADAPLTLHLPAAVSFVSADGGGIYQSSDHTVRWNPVALIPEHKLVFSVMGLVPAGANLGDQLVSSVEYGPPAGDAHPADNASTCTQLVVGALDPNDKRVSPQGVIPPDQLLSYQIDFQNVGTAAATNVRVEDTLDEDLDLATIVLGSTSHPATQVYVNGRTVTWEFNGINLPDSTSDGPQSHGFVAFQARPLAGLPSGREIVNGGRVYFDFAPAVETNLVANSILDAAGLGSSPAAAGVFAVTSIGPVPARGSVFVNLSLPARGELSERIYDAGGRLVRTLAGGAYAAGTVQLTWDRRNDLGRRVGSGVYFLRSVWAGSEGRSTANSRLVLLE